MNAILKEEKLNSASSRVVAQRITKAGFLHKSEDEKLKEDMHRPPFEKLQLFTQMLRREAELKKAKIFQR